MTPQPSIQDSYVLISGLPASMHNHVIHLLMCLRLQSGPNGVADVGNDDLARQMHVDPSSVKRAVGLAQQDALITCAYKYRIGGQTIPSPEPPNSLQAPHGRFSGRVISINWNVLKRFQDIRGVTVSPQTEETNPFVEGSIEPAIGGSTGASGREGTGTKEKIHNDSTATPTPSHISDVASRSALQAMQGLFLSAQAARRTSVHRRMDMVYGRRSASALAKFVEQFPAQGIWLPWMRVANLFSFWIEHHPLKNLKDPIRAFIAQHDLWLDDLTKWESTSTGEFRAIHTKSDDLAAGVPVNDAEVTELIGFTYEKSAITITTLDAQRVLQFYSLDDLKGAVGELVYVTDASRLPKAIRDFYSGGAAAAVIYARQHRKPKVTEDAAISGGVVQ